VAFHQLQYTASLDHIVASKQVDYFKSYLHRIAVAVARKVVIGKLIVDLGSSSSSQTTFVAAASASFLPLSSAASS